MAVTEGKSRTQIIAQFAAMANWGSAATGPIQFLVSTTLEDLAVVMEATSKRKVNEE